MITLSFHRLCYVIECQPDLLPDQIRLTVNVQRFFYAKNLLTLYQWDSLKYDQIYQNIPTNINNTKSHLFRTNAPEAPRAQISMGWFPNETSIHVILRWYSWECHREMRITGIVRIPWPHGMMGWETRRCHTVVMRMVAVWSYYDQLWNR